MDYAFTTLDYLAALALAFLIGAALGGAGMTVLILKLRARQDLAIEENRARMREALASGRVEIQK